jgi:hypothetical protein
VGKNLFYVSDYTESLQQQAKAFYGASISLEQQKIRYVSDTFYVIGNTRINSSQQKTS